ncbi:hypothetical protein [Actinotalea solisilvae]|uniref:hypothetical protein n=1 Tax=Actinotalea solisilvae TaxID=2072922 RepID=UPI0018F1A3C5|nr:hypothetical protein [Actinotalea solisilvae]
MRTSRKIMVAVPIATALIAGGAFAVYSGTSGDGDVTSPPAAAPTSQPTASATAPVADVTPGQVLPEEPEALPKDFTSYPMLDGTFVAVAEDQPLPDAVRKAAVAAYDAEVAELTDPNSNEQLSQLAQTFARYMDQQEDATGKKLVVIHRLFGYTLESDYTPVWSYFIGTPHFDADLPMDRPDRESAVAAAQAWIDTKSNPAAWDIIVIEN